MFYPLWLLSLRSLLFSQEEMEEEWMWGKGVVWGELGGVGGEETEAGTYCMGEESIFNNF